MLGSRFRNLLMMFGIGTFVVINNIYIFYPQIQQRKLLLLLKQLDKENKIEEMKEVLKSPYLKGCVYEFKNKVDTK